MNAKDYLNQIYFLERKINNKNAEIFQLRAMSTSITIATDTERVQTSGNKDKVSDCVVKIADAIDELNAIVDVYLVRRKEIMSVIEKIKNPTYYQLICLRYVHRKDFQSIADEMMYSWRHIMRLHDEAIKDFQKILDSDTSKTA